MNARDFFNVLSRAPGAFPRQAFLERDVHGKAGQGDAAALSVDKHVFDEFERACENQGAFD